MKITFFSTQPYDRSFFIEHNTYNLKLEFHEAALDEVTVELVKKSEAVCVFVNDTINAKVIECLAA